ncbi:oxygenase MpaB family protein [Streptomyces sp. NPDC097619]|uniref:oxygenase MpaB family protein n=1 Tax=Streptomyces sp. NPDC097619 TaxID=3157228 RepID=UPI003332FA38
MDPLPPPRDGILWNVTGDLRMLLLLPASFLLQVADPAIAAGVDRHSVFRTDPWGRGVRSVESVQRWVYGGADAAAEGRRLRRLHRDIHGTAPDGTPYRALDPDTWAWVHASGFAVQLHAFGLLWPRPLDPAETEALYAEWLRLGRVLGIHDRDMPPDATAYREHFHHVVTTRLRLTGVARELLDTDAALPAPDRGPRPLRIALRLLWPLLRRPFLRLRAFLTVGYLPPEARTALGLPWTPGRQRRLRLFSRAVGVLVALLPDRLRYLPLARRARAAAP